jgi:autotransporter-associated beta strand protein
MKNRSQLFFMALAVAATSSSLQAQLVWDTGTAAGFQNANGTWGTDNFWTTTTGGTSTPPASLTGWTANQTAYLGGNATVAASPGGDFAITVSGTQVATSIRQIQNGAGNFTLQGGELQSNSFRVDRATMTVNSVIGTYTNVANARVDFSAQPGTSALLILGGNNTLTNNVGIAGGSSGGGTVRLNHQNALGLGNSVFFLHNTLLDLNGFDVSGKTITVNNSRTGFLGNTAATKSVWSGNVDLNTAGNGSLWAGGTGAEVEISGVISGSNAVASLDNGVLRLTGNNTYTGGNSVRAGSKLIVGNGNALGAVSGTTFIGSGTLDLNGFDIGNRNIYFQQNDSRLVNDNATTAALHSGTIQMQFNRSNSQIGGAGDLTLSGNIIIASGSTTGGGLTKVGVGTLTLSGTNTYTGATTVSAGTLVVNGDQSAAIGAVTVASIATLGGTGTLGGATAVSGILAPGSGGIGTLTIANDVTWNGGQNWLFELGAAGASLGSPGTSDLLSIAGNNDFLRGTGSSWTFDFAGTGAQGWYKLADWTGGSTTFSPGDFTATNLAGGNTGEFTVQNDALYMQVVPEPATWSLAAAGLAGAAWSLTRRRRSV